MKNKNDEQDRTDQVHVVDSLVVYCPIFTFAEFPQGVVDAYRSGDLDLARDTLTAKATETFFWELASDSSLLFRIDFFVETPVLSGTFATFDKNSISIPMGSTKNSIEEQLRAVAKEMSGKAAHAYLLACILLKEAINAGELSDRDDYVYVSYPAIVYNPGDDIDKPKLLELRWALFKNNQRFVR